LRHYNSPVTKIVTKTILWGGFLFGADGPLSAIQGNLIGGVLLLAALVPFQGADHAVHNVYAVDISVNVY